VVAASVADRGEEPGIAVHIVRGVGIPPNAAWSGDSAVGGHGQIAITTDFATVMVQIAIVAFSRLPKAAKEDIAKLFVRAFADTAGVPTSAVRDLRGRSGSVSLAPGEHEAGALLFKGGLLAQAHIDLPVTPLWKRSHGGDVGAVIAALRGSALRQHLAQSLSKVHGIQQAVLGPATQGRFVSACHVHVWERSSGAMTAGDSDKSGTMDSKEFLGAEKAFRPPLAKDEAKEAFEAFDRDGDGELSSAEFGHAASRRRTTSTVTTTSATSSTATSSSTTRTTSTATTATSTTATSTTATTTSITVSTSTATTSTATTSTATTSTETTSVSTTTTTTTPIPITMVEFRRCLLNAYDSPNRAFASLDVNRNSDVDLTSFVAGTRTFKPPLTEAQARYAFRGLDLDKSNSLSPFEFFEVLEAGDFFPTSEQLQHARTVPMRAPVLATSELQQGPLFAALAAGVVVLAVLGWCLMQVCKRCLPSLPCWCAKNYKVVMDEFPGPGDSPRAAPGPETPEVPEVPEVPERGPKWERDTMRWEPTSTPVDLSSLLAAEDTEVPICADHGHSVSLAHLGHRITEMALVIVHALGGCAPASMGDAEPRPMVQVCVQPAMSMSRL